MSEMCLIPCLFASFAIGSDDVHGIAGHVACRFFSIPPHSACNSQTVFPRFLRFAFHLRSCVASGSLGGTGFCGIAGHVSWELCFVLGVLSAIGCALRSRSSFWKVFESYACDRFLGETMEVSDAKPIRMLTFESTRYPFLFLRFVPLIHLVVGKQDTKGFADQMLA